MMFVCVIHQEQFNDKNLKQNLFIKSRRRKTLQNFFFLAMHVVRRTLPLSTASGDSDSSGTGVADAVPMTAMTMMKRTATMAMLNFVDEVIFLASWRNDESDDELKNLPAE